MGAGTSILRKWRTSWRTFELVRETILILDESLQNESLLLSMEHCVCVKRSASSCLTSLVISGRSSCRGKHSVPRACTQSSLRSYTPTSVMRNAAGKEGQGDLQPTQSKKLKKGVVNLNLPETKKEVSARCSVQIPLQLQVLHWCTSCTSQHCKWFHYSWSLTQFL